MSKSPPPQSIINPLTPAPFFLFFFSDSKTNHFITYPKAWRLRTSAVNVASDFSPVIAFSVLEEVLFTRHMEKAVS